MTEQSSISLLTPSVVIDNTDPAVEYTGPWLLVSQGGLSLDGPPMFKTLHALSNFNGTISYNFTGIAGFRVLLWLS